MHVAILPINHISVFYMEICVNGGSNIKYTYIIDQKYSHVVLQKHASIFLYKGRVMSWPWPSLDDTTQCWWGIFPRTWTGIKLDSVGSRM